MKMSKYMILSKYIIFFFMSLLNFFFSTALAVPQVELPGDPGYTHAIRRRISAHVQKVHFVLKSIPTNLNLARDLNDQFKLNCHTPVHTLLLQELTLKGKRFTLYQLTRKSWSGNY